jgi:indolepyruvate ferredoxin oxidoreductase
MGDALFANMLLLGYAWQKGLVPVSASALDKAIELNGTAVEANRQAFLWGRRAAAEPQRVARTRRRANARCRLAATFPDELIAQRSEHLTAYQDARLAEPLPPAPGRHPRPRRRGTDAPRRRSIRPPARPQGRMGGRPPARDAAFQRQLAETFSGDYRLAFHFAPPLLARVGSDGRPRKLRFGPWMLPVLKGHGSAAPLARQLARPFRFAADKALDRQLLADYEADLELIAGQADPAAGSWPPGRARSVASARSCQGRRQGAAMIRQEARAALMA